MAEANKGWICLHRQTQDCVLWIDEEPFDRRSAWVDLLLSCNHRDKEILFNGHPITIKRGQYLTSVRKLAEHWHWSVNRTARYLKLLEELQMIEKNSDNYRTLLTIVNYGLYQDAPNTNEYTNRHTSGDTDEYTDESQTTMINNDNNVNNNTSLQEVCKLYNTICVSYPKMKSLSETRKKAIKARMKTYNLDDFKTLFEKAEASDFLKGKNNRDWSATFDWLIKDTNMAKVLDGNYDNKKGGSNEPDNSTTTYGCRYNLYK